MKLLNNNEIASASAKLHSRLASADKSAAPRHHNDNAYRLTWKDNLAVQRLLDVISSILADEYIRVAKENKEVFMDPGYSASRNSGMTNGRAPRPSENKEEK